MKTNHHQRQRRTWAEKFGCAFQGLWCAFRHDRTFVIHGAMAVAVMIAAVLLRASVVEWSLLILCIGFVVTAEMLNTSIEALAKHISEEDSPWIRMALDMGAGAVLLASLTAAMVGIMIFLSKL